jgi:DNA-binding transcriptional ArsR family regulator
MPDKPSKTTARKMALTPVAPVDSDNHVRLLQAVADPVRWGILRELAAGEPLPVQELAARLGRDANLISKHLRVLRETGAVSVSPSPDGDGRKQCYAVPPAFRRVDEAGRPMLDYGVCALRVFADQPPAPTPAVSSIPAVSPPAAPPTTVGLNPEQSDWID